VRFRLKVYKLEEVPLPDYSKINREMEKLEKEENMEEVILRVKEEVAKAALRKA
jgi:adenylate kinase family enzyme